MPYPAVVALVEIIVLLGEEETTRLALVPL
jgi:hypothetical protein